MGDRGCGSCSLPYPPYQVPAVLDMPYCTCLLYLAVP